MEVWVARRKSTVLSFAAVVLMSVWNAGPVLAQTADVQAHPPIRINGTAQLGLVGVTPDQVRHAYGFDAIANQGAGQTIAIVDAYDNPSVEKDLAIFDQQFGLPPCTSSNGCFQKINASRNPGVDTMWALEIAL